LGALLIVAGAAGLLGATVNLKGAHVSNDRTLNEIANNGGISFVAAFVTRNLDFAANYKTLPLDEAYQRARRLLAEPKTQFSEEPAASPSPPQEEWKAVSIQSIHRRILGTTNALRLNVVIFLEESLGSEFWGCLGRT